MTASRTAIECAFWACPTDRSNIHFAEVFDTQPCAASKRGRRANVRCERNGLARRSARLRSRRAARMKGRAREPGPEQEHSLDRSNVANVNEADTRELAIAGKRSVEDFRNLSAKRRLCNTVGITATGCAADCCAISAPLLETNCLAGHIGFELANPSASYLIVIAWQLRLRWAQLRWRRHFACRLSDAHLQLGPEISASLSANGGQHPEHRIGSGAWKVEVATISLA
jgi:hypothetical protein